MMKDFSPILLKYYYLQCTPVQYASTLLLLATSSTLPRKCVIRRTSQQAGESVSPPASSSTITLVIVQQSAIMVIHTNSANLVLVQYYGRTGLCLTKKMNLERGSRRNCHSARNKSEFCTSCQLPAHCFQCSSRRPAIVASISRSYQLLVLE